MRLRISPLIRWIVIYGVLVGMIGFVPVAGARVLLSDPPPCTDMGCNGSDPGICINDNHHAITAKSAYAPIPVNLAYSPAFNGVIFISLRYSPWCNAYWAQGGYMVPSSNPLGTWSIDIQLTRARPEWTIVNRFLIRSSDGDNDGYTSMYYHEGLSFDACLQIFTKDKKFDTRVCTNRVRVDFVNGGTVSKYQNQAGSIKPIGTSCLFPWANPRNTWKFLVSGLPDPRSTTPHKVVQLYDGVDGRWLNYQDTRFSLPNPLCQCLGNWPMRVEPIIYDPSYAIEGDEVFAGMYFYVAAWSTGATGPVAGRTYRVEVYDSYLEDSVFPTYPEMLQTPSFPSDPQCPTR